MTGRIMSVGVAISVLLTGCGGESEPVAPPPPPPTPVVTTVEVAVAAGTLLPGDTTVATATVKDQNGAIMNGQTVTWTSSAAPATVTAAGVVTAASSGNANVVATVGTKTGSAAVTVVNDPRLGYIWANGPSETTYTVDNGYEYLSSGSKATIVRAGTGQYAVTMTGLGAAAGQRTNVQVSAYGSGSSYCKAGGWQTTGSDLVVDVRCFDTTGNPVDAYYTLLAVGGTSLDGRLGFALGHDPSAAAAYTPQQARSSRAGAVSITRTGAGAYTLTLSALNRTATDGPEGVFVTAVGNGSERCWVGAWLRDVFSARISCVNAAGNPTDAKFSVLVVEKGRSAAKAAFIWADEADAAAPYNPTAVYSYNSAGGTNQVTRDETGVYSVNFANMDRTPGAAETFIVNAYGSEDRRCRIGSWGGAVGVSIYCYDAAGNPADSQFDLLVIQ